MNLKRLILAIVVGWAVIFGTDILVHHFALMPDYEATKSIWRPEPEMVSRIYWMFVAQFLGVATFVIVWAKGFAGGSAGTGAIFGLLMGLFQAIWVLMNYVLFPLPGNLAVKWFGCGMIQTILLGVVTALVYRPAAPAAEE